MAEAVPVPVGAGSGVFMLRIQAAKMFLADTFAVVVGNVERNANRFFDGVPARIVAAVQEGYCRRRGGLDLRQERWQRVQGRR